MGELKSIEINIIQWIYKLENAYHWHGQQQQTQLSRLKREYALVDSFSENYFKKHLYDW